MMPTLNVTPAQFVFQTMVGEAQSQDLDLLVVPRKGERVMFDNRQWTVRNLVWDMLGEQTRYDVFIFCDLTEDTLTTKS